ncbi:DUF1501 domain-containing protein [Thioclava sp. FR2]|uniref:DUF1501 domain-containing protein n=1 Tax=Thioclava sp. FR2 TaxID=3445780 RepID=UPI003EBCB821
MDRRKFLRGLATAACSTAAHPWLTTVTLAGSEDSQLLGENRLVVVILRGAMDGLDLLRPTFEPDLARYRPSLMQDTLPLDNRFALHGSLHALLPLWTSGELGFVHATSTPYRDQRSHFDGQDILEAGTGLDLPDAAIRDGWLNRVLQSVPGLTSETAYAIGRDAIPLLAGDAPVVNWTPEVTLDLSAQTKLLLDHIYHDDDLFREAATEAMAVAEEAALSMMAAPADGQTDRALKGIDRLAEFAARRLRGQTRIAAFSLTGWDTHRNQSGSFHRPLGQLERVILQMKSGLGPEVWGKTVLLAMTEFGRTVAENGNKGTDHGTGGAMVLAGGALRGGRVMGQWPGLDEASLYARRDLMPTSDVRAWAAWAMRSLFGLDRSLLETSIFPGLDMGNDPSLLL